MFIENSETKFSANVKFLIVIEQLTKSKSSSSKLARTATFEITIRQLRIFIQQRVQNWSAEKNIFTNGEAQFLFSQKLRQFIEADTLMERINLRTH